MCGLDCADDVTVNPNAPRMNGANPEVCNGIDDDCSGRVDDVRTLVYFDCDGDGFGDARRAGIVGCPRPATDLDCPVARAPTASLVNAAGDCDDAAPTAHPGAVEACNTVDDNCDGMIDEGLTGVYCHDGDADGYGDPADCSPTGCPRAGDAPNGGDCCDLDAAAYPGQTRFFTAITACGGYDFDCNRSWEVEENHLDLTACPVGPYLCMPGGGGWIVQPCGRDLLGRPISCCGGSIDFHYCTSSISGCRDGGTTSRVVACR